MTLPRCRRLAVAALAAPLLLGACSGDPLNSSLRPTPEDKAARPKPAPEGSVAALIRVGDSMREAGNSSAAISFYKRAHARAVFEPEPLVHLGQALNDVGAYNEAAEAFRDALDLAHEDTRALRGLGTAMIGLQQPQLAVDHFEAALALEEDYRNYNGIGVALDRLAKHGEAQAYYTVGLEMAPENLTLLNNLGLSYALSGDHDKAIETLTRAANHPDAAMRQRQNLALAYGLAGRSEEAARVARMDLDETAVQSNLAYYSTLRALAEDGRAGAEALGIHAGPSRLETLAPQAGTGPDGASEPIAPAGAASETPARP